MRVYGSAISYYTGKLEAYLRYKEIPYDFEPLSFRSMRRVARKTGAQQMPAIELPDGRWLTDTTPIIDWIEAQHPKPAVIPEDPLQGFFSRLVEDYADEWMWRPAMHYRWSYRGDARLLSRRIVDEMGQGIPLPGWIKRRLIYRRQLHNYVRGDGVSDTTWDHVEGIYKKTLAQLEAIFATRPYLLGERPTLADFGFMASMFRHFGQDPTPSALMRETAPGVFEWQARVWNAKAGVVNGPLVDGIPTDWNGLLDEIGSAYLPYLCDNAKAWAAGLKSFGATVQGVSYRNMPTSPYRVWCLERLRMHYDALPAEMADIARARLEAHGCWEPLFRIENLDSGYDPEGRVPFAGGRVFPKRLLD
jgi:glutathione S-transferase